VIARIFHILNAEEVSLGLIVPILPTAIAGRCKGLSYPSDAASSFVWAVWLHLTSARISLVLSILSDVFGGIFEDF
jgi:hypothetical protein